jgi:hypothetical protein
MLEMKGKCERCETELPAESGEAWICSFECTFCSTCRAELVICPNCGGELVRRPRRNPK